MQNCWNQMRMVGLLACLLLSGCQLVGAVGDKVFGPGTNPPDYAPPKDQPLLVLVENYRSPGYLQQPSDQLAALITDRLSENKVGPMISTEKLVTMRTERANEFGKMKIPDIGRALGAKQVIYINLKECDMEGIIGSNDIRGTIAAAVRVVDVASGQTKWPDVGDGKEFTSSTAYTRKDARDTEETIRNMMLDDLADDISILFYPHEDKGNAPTD